ncbi:MAG: GTPase RsgA [Ilumatobacteraceae bacterium]
MAALLADAAHPARLTSRDRGRLAAVDHDGPTAVRFRPDLTVGDWVSLVPSGLTAEPWSVDHVAERWSVLERVDPVSQGRSVDTAQLLAANVDIVASVVPLDRPVSANRIEREAVAVWDAGARPIVVLTKADRTHRADAESPEEIGTALADRLRGVEVFVTSAVDGSGLDAVREQIPAGVTAMLLGASGAGKSTLANALVGSQILATGAVRDADSRGRHTTTSRQLVPIPGAGVLLDAPGILQLRAARRRGRRRVRRHVRGSRGAGDAVPLLGLRPSGRARMCDRGRDDVGRRRSRRIASWRKLQRELAFERRRGDRAACGEGTGPVEGHQQAEPLGAALTVIPGRGPITTPR